MNGCVTVLLRSWHFYDYLQRMSAEDAMNVYFVSSQQHKQCVATSKICWWWVIVDCYLDNITCRSSLRKVLWRFGGEDDTLMATVFENNASRGCKYNMPRLEWHGTVVDEPDFYRKQFLSTSKSSTKGGTMVKIALLGLFTRGCTCLEKIQWVPAWILSVLEKLSHLEDIWLMRCTDIRTIVFVETLNEGCSCAATVK